MNDSNHRAPLDPDAVIRELRVRVGLLQSELEHLRREHASLKASISHDIAALARRYLEAPKPAAGVRTVDGVIFGGWDRLDGAPAEGASDANEPDRNSRSA
jgi:uncharacterized small protein (DUF1192 family)